MNLDEITTGPFTSLSDLIDLEESLVDLREPVDPLNPLTTWAFSGQPVPSFQSIFTTKKSIGAAEIIEIDLIKTFREHYAKLAGRTPDMPQPVSARN